MIPLVTLHGSSDIELIKDRSPDTEHGRLFDFSKNRERLKEKLKTGPTLCDEEASGIRKAFGKHILKEYENVLKRVSSKFPLSN